jgi:hypothetical protein
LSSVLGALWLLGLFAAAPVLRTDARYDFTDRLRDALVLGVAIPFALGFAQLLYPLMCWVALAGCIGFGARRWQKRRHADRTAPYLLLAALAIVAWPQLMRPLLDGDSLSYH